MMTPLLHIARPYTAAAFFYARNNQQLPAWKNFLKTAALLAEDTRVVNLLNNPKISQHQLVDLFHHVLAAIMNPPQKNFLLLLALHHRFIALPDIAQLFDAYCASFEKMHAVRMITAIQIEKEMQQKFSQQLIKRIQHEITLQCEVDPAILGGAIIHIGDHVIDGSLRGKLSRLLDFSLRS